MLARGPDARGRSGCGPPPPWPASGWAWSRPQGAVSWELREAATALIQFGRKIGGGAGVSPMGLLGEAQAGAPSSRDALAAGIRSVYWALVAPALPALGATGAILFTARREPASPDPGGAASTNLAPGEHAAGRRGRRRPRGVHSA